MSLLARITGGCVLALVGGMYPRSSSIAAEPSAPQPAVAESDGPAGTTFRAGTAAIEITPTEFPRIIAGSFLENQASAVNSRLFARGFVLDDGVTRLALVVVDTCMMPADLIDDAKRLAAERCDIRVDHMMVSATHTHAAPAAMGCLGTRQDPEYAAALPAMIAEAMVAAEANLQPARIGWATIDDWEHTHNRRWIRKPERMVVDPFGNATGRAHMHPGYQSPDVIGPSGPVDPQLSLLALQTPDGQPLGVFANYSQHYFGAAPVSADYYGRFCQYVAETLDQPGEGNGPFVCAMSQGTSGDLMWMDYGSPRKQLGMERYADAVGAYAKRALDAVRYHDTATLAMAEKKLAVRYRVPDRERLAWARPIADAIEDGLAKDKTEVYAREALILHERQSTELTLQAIRIGDLTIATLPNEVYALTGLKLKAQAPLKAHLNVGLANGAEGYIPPPEQHALGGYTTWPARTAGLEVEAEPKIVETLLRALEEVSGSPRREMAARHGAYAKAILEAAPLGYWRLDDAAGTLARNAVAGGRPARLRPGFAWYLPGVGSGSGIGEQQRLRPSNFSGFHDTGTDESGGHAAGPSVINRAVHFAGGSLEVDLHDAAAPCSVAVWFWLGERSGASERSGTLVALPGGGALVAEQGDDHRVRLRWGDAVADLKAPADQWQFAVLVRDDQGVRVHVDGDETPTLTAGMDEQAAAETSTTTVRFAEGLQGKLDEIALFDRALDGAEIRAFGQAAGIPKPATEPRAAAESIRGIHVPDGFRVELVAAEPDLLDPVAFDWDHHGRLWVVEMADYPLGMDGKGQPGGRVRVLEDTDGDGRYDTSRLFAEGLNFPTGILTWRDGVIVTAAPEILWLHDSDGDGRADVREVLIEGFHEGNQQLRINGLRWGLDGWVHCANGGHHAGYGTRTEVRSRRTGKTHAIGSRDFCFRPDSGELRSESGPTQFGRNRDAWGNWFGTQNANPLWHYVIDDRYLSRNPHVPAPQPTRHLIGPGSPKVFPASPPEKRYHNFDQSGRFTSACGGMIDGDDRLFGPTDESHAFICEPFHNLVQHQVLAVKGPSFEARRGRGEEEHDFFASEDRWCRPVMTRTGPDGALWVADMYRYMIEHPEWLPQEGKDELLPHYRLGDDRGRIYRVVADQIEPRDIASLAGTLRGSDLRSLVQAIDSPNAWQRDKVHQMLLWDPDPDAVPLLAEVHRASPLPEVRVQTLWVLESLGGLDASLLLRALRDDHPRVRQTAIRLGERRDAPEIVGAATRLARDPDPHVRLQLALSCGQWSDRRAGQALADIAIAADDDPLMVAAVMSSAIPHIEVLLSAILDAEPTTVAKYRPSLLRQALGSGDRHSILRMLDDSLTGTESDQAAGLGEFLAALDRIGSSLDDLADADPDAPLRARLATAETLLRTAVDTVNDADEDGARRLAAARLLSHSPPHRDFAADNLADWLRPHVDGATQADAMTSLARTAAESVPEILAGAWPGMSPKLRSEALAVWLSRNAWTEDLLRRIDRGDILPSDLEPVQQSRLKNHPDKNIARLARSLFATDNASAPKERIEQYRQALQLRGDSKRGRAVYVKTCASCHRRGDQGHHLGPDLATVVQHPPEKLLANILDPNADIQPGYQVYNCLLVSGEVLSGILSGETANSLTIASANGTVRTVGRDEVEELQNLGISLMPEGLHEQLSLQDMADLLAFLKEPIE